MFLHTPSFPWLMFEKNALPVNGPLSPGWSWLEQVRRARVCEWMMEHFLPSSGMSNPIGQLKNTKLWCLLFLGMCRNLRFSRGIVPLSLRHSQMGGVPPSWDGETAPICSPPTPSQLAKQSTRIRGKKGCCGHPFFKLPQFKIYKPLNRKKQTTDR